MQPCVQQQRSVPGASALLRQRGEREDGGHQQEVQTRPGVRWSDGALRPPGPLHRPAVPGDTQRANGILPFHFGLLRL